MDIKTQLLAILGTEDPSKPEETSSYHTTSFRTSVNEEENVLQASTIYTCEATDMLFLDEDFVDIPLSDYKLPMLDENVPNTFLNIALVGGYITKERRDYYEHNYNLLHNAYKKCQANIECIYKRVRKAQKKIKLHQNIEKIFNIVPESIEPIRKWKGVTLSCKQGEKHLTLEIKSAEERMKLLALQNELCGYNARYETLKNITESLECERESLQHKYDRIIHETPPMEKAYVVNVCERKPSKDMTELSMFRECTMSEINDMKTEIKGVITVRNLLEEYRLQSLFIKYTDIEEAILVLEEQTAEIESLTKMREDLKGKLEITGKKLLNVDMLRIKVENQLDENRKKVKEVNTNILDIKLKIKEEQKTAMQFNRKLFKSRIWLNFHGEHLQNVVNMLSQINERLHAANDECAIISGFGEVLHEQMAALHSITQDKKRNYEKLTDHRNMLSNEIEDIKKKEAEKMKLYEIVVYYDEVQKKKAEMESAKQKLITLIKQTHLYYEENQEKVCKLLHLLVQKHHLTTANKILCQREKFIVDHLKRKLCQLNEGHQKFGKDRAERNTDYQSIIIANQKLVEWREKVKILSIEVENLKTLKRQRIRQYQRLVGQLQMSEMERSILTAEQMTLSHQIKKMKMGYEAAEELLARAKRSIAACQQEISQEQKLYDKVVSERNLCGQQMRDCLEEGTILTEKIKTFKNILDRADSELEQRSEVSGRLHTIKRAERNDVQLLQQIEAGKCAQLDNLVVLCNELETVTHREASYELLFNIGTRHIIKCENISDEDIETLQEKLGNLKHRVQENETRLVEMKLVYNHILNLTNKLKEESAQQFQVGNSTMKEKIKTDEKKNSTSRKIKSLAVELKLARNTAQALAQELQVKRKELEEATQRVERGEAPTVEIEQEWKNMERRDSTRPLSPPPTPFCCTPRPTSYIPESEAPILCTPRPYGALAPFKPLPPAHKLSFYKSNKHNSKKINTDDAQAICKSQGE